MKSNRTNLLVAFVAGVFILSFAAGSVGQNNAPPRALSVASQLRIVTWEEVVPGFLASRTIAPNGVEVVIFRISPTMHDFDLAVQGSANGERVAEVGRTTGAQIVFNGGFFSINKKGAKYPVGLLAINNRKISAAWKKSGGYLVFRGNGISIQPTRGQAVPKGDAVLQSKPMLIEPGSKWAMNTNGAIARKRTLVCQQKDGDIVILAIIAGGLSLYEAGWLMRGADVGGVFGCDSALAMDGGGSTQIWVKDRPDLSFAGETPVHNAIIIRPRPPE